MAHDPCCFQTSRTLPYPPARVFAAFANAPLLAQWWGPAGFSNTFSRFDFCEGGKWQFVMHGPDGTDYPNQSVFRAIEPDRKIVLEHTCAPFFTLSIELCPVESGTRLVWEQRFDDLATAQAVADIVRPANEQNLDRLHAVLNTTAAEAATL